MMYISLGLVPPVFSKFGIEIFPNLPEYLHNLCIIPYELYPNRGARKDATTSLVGFSKPQLSPTTVVSSLCVVASIAYVD